MNGFLDNIERVNDNLHAYFLRMAYIHASQESDDPRTHTGAAIPIKTQDTHPYVWNAILGANSLPEGIPKKPEYLENEVKKDYLPHAETKAINRCAKAGISTRGATMYMPWFPCAPCAQSIIDSGIETLIGHLQLIERTPERWMPSLERAYDLLIQGKVNLKVYDGKIGGIIHLFNGERWEP